jgi:DNA-binding transcriptional regulator YiaG
MTAKEYRVAINKLGLSQRKAAHFLGVNERTSRRWIDGTPIPHAVGLLLRLMIKEKLLPEDVESKCG